MFADVFRDRSVLVTGHTGFKGSWLCAWLLRLGARVHGYALDPQPDQILYDQLGLSSQLETDTRNDIRNGVAVAEAVKRGEPEFIFHLAAQPLVRLSYETPVETFDTNVMGTVNVAEAIRIWGGNCNVVFVTTDKCYENREWLQSYREEDAMGGYDPYSASKGCAELVVSAYRRSYFAGAAPTHIASARAGNVIGGGDWASDRIIPDIFRAVNAGRQVPIRNQLATRPWQHVMEPLSGYLWLAANLDSAAEPRGYHPADFCSAFNFGPELSSNRTVAEVVKAVLEHIDGSWFDASSSNARHEASKLNLAIDKAFHMLEWQPTWDFETTIRKTVQWYVDSCDCKTASYITHQQIDEYQSAAEACRQAWAS